MGDNIRLSAGPVISTQEEARNFHDIGFDWKIIAKCNRRNMIWKWYMDGSEAIKVRPAVDSGIIIMVQRRDPDTTVLLAKWAKLI